MNPRLLNGHYLRVQRRFFFRNLSPAMVIQIGEIPEIARDNGWRSEDLETYMRQRLQRAGVEVVTKDNPNWFQFPALRLTVSMNYTANGSYRYALRMRAGNNLAALVKSDGPRSDVPHSDVPAYDTKWSGFLEGKDVTEARMLTDALVDQFLSAYSIENPKIP